MQSYANDISAQGDIKTSDLPIPFKLFTLTTALETVTYVLGSVI